MFALAAVLLAAAAGAAGSDLYPVALTATDDPMAETRVGVIGDLAEGTVLAITVGGADGGAHGSVRQCRVDADDFTGCHNVFAVVFDEEGRSVFQYRLDDTGTCGPSDTCVVVVDDLEGNQAWVYTVFGAPAPIPPPVALTPPGLVTPGDVVEVAVGPSPAGTRFDVAFCDDFCGDAIQITADVDGLATARVEIGDRCVRCGVRVRTGPAQSFQAVSFTNPPEAEYDSWRVVAGLTVALALAVTAWWLIRRTDWRPPSEAATPELDALDQRETIDA